jgi:hypothetical protein
MKPINYQVKVTLILKLKIEVDLNKVILHIEEM